MNSKIAKNSAIYISSSFLNSLIPFLLLPVLTRFLSPSEFGLVSLFGAYVTILLPFVNPSLQGAFIRNFYDDSIDNHSYRFQIILLIFLNFFIVAILMFFIVIVFKVPLLADLPIEWLFLGCLLALGTSIFEIQKASWQISEHVVKYTFFQNLKTVFEYLLAIFLLYLCFGAAGVVLSRVGVSMVFGIFAILAMLKSDLSSYLRSKEKRRYALNALAFGLPLLPHALSGVINSAGSKIIISHILGPSETAFVSIALQFGGIVSLFLTSVHLAFTPWFFRSMAARGQKQDAKIVKVTYFLFSVAVIAALIVILVAPFVLRIMTTEQYWQAASLIPWFVVALTFQGSYIFLSVYILFSGKTYYLSLITISSSICYLIAAWFTTLNFGSKGLAVCYTLMMVTKFVVTWLVSARLVKMPWLSGLR